MTTTAIFVELLVTGLLALVWLILAILSFTGMPWNELAGFLGLKEKEGISSILALGFAYVVGIVVDRISDSLFRRFDVRIRKSRIHAKVPSVSEMRLYVMSVNEKLSAFLDYLRSRLRLARSSALNFFLITLAAAIFSATRNSNGRELVFAITIGGLGLTLATGYAWYRISRTYYKRLVQSYEILKGQEGHRASHTTL